MVKKNVDVVGVIIDSENQFYKIYQNYKTYTTEGIKTVGSVLLSGVGNALQQFEIQAGILLITEATRFVVVYNASCPKGSENLQKLVDGLNKIKKNNFSPKLIPMGDEQKHWSQDVAIPEGLFKKIVQDELNSIDKQINWTPSNNPSSLKNSPKTRNVSMVVLSGFIAVAGIAAIAIAFTVLNAATFGVAGIVTAIIGSAAILSSIGLFTANTAGARQKSIDEPLLNSLAI